MCIDIMISRGESTVRGYSTAEFERWRRLLANMSMRNQQCIQVLTIMHRDMHRSFQLPIKRTNGFQKLRTSNIMATIHECNTVRQPSPFKENRIRKKEENTRYNRIGFLPEHVDRKGLAHQYEPIPARQSCRR